MKGGEVPRTSDAVVVELAHEPINYYKASPKETISISLAVVGIA
jgi:hypothetical protein